MRVKRLLPSILLFASVASSHAGELRGNLARKLREREDDDDGEVHVLVGYHKAKAKECVKKLQNVTVKHEFDKYQTIAAVLPKSEVWHLVEDEDVDYIQEDQMMYPDGMGEIVPYGIMMSQNPNVANGATNGGGGGSNVDCSDDKVFKVAIIDSGMWVGHADLPCRSKNAANCIGREFGLSNSNERWFNPENPHGTHVAGTIGALGNNDEGVVGMIPDGDVCYIIARVFGDKSEGARFSDILSAVLWTVKKGAKVINMSLGGTEQDSSAEKVFQSIYNDDGRLVVASSGNSGTTDDRYPASYDTVISVAAVDQNYNKAEFSQYNKNVDIAAPGVDILSTLPANKGYILNIFVEDGRVFSGQKMQYSPDIGNTISGNLALCGSYGQNGCDANGKICLIERGKITFEEKALACQKGGGIACIVYNNEDGQFSGTLSGTDTKVSIPAVSLTAEDGQTLINKYLKDNVVLKEEYGYGYLSGTSMAAPHVTGAIAAIWRECPACSNKQVESCLLSTALDLGSSGKDVKFGAGLIQTEDAYACLLGKCC